MLPVLSGKRGSSLLILEKYHRTRLSCKQMGDIYSPFISLEQAKCYSLELTAAVGVYVSLCVRACLCFCATLTFVYCKTEVFKLWGIPIQGSTRKLLGGCLGEM